MSGRENQPTELLAEPLTRREREILALLAQEHSAPEIAQSLTLAVSSVKWYIQQVYGKLGVNSKRQAIARARELGLLEAPAAPASTPAVSAPTAPEQKHNIPVQVTSFFGRETEIEQLKQRLAEHRLVTLTGSGGVGETRLSLQAARVVEPAFTDGVWLVELSTLADPALVPQHVAAALSVHENASRSVLENLAAFLRGRRLLLVLDNCEHLLEACAQLVDALLRAAPGLTVLASSREPLNIAGEAVFGVRSLPFPDPARLPPLEQLSGYPAIRLFVDRARLVLPDYQVAEHNALPLAQICQRLDGIPLAIEMAAARVNILNAASLAARLDDAFRVLTGGSRTALPRQQTLRATIDWSYALLIDPERRLLQRLSVFAGGCTLEAAEVVCADGREAGAGPIVPMIGESEILDLLSSLVSKSIVIADRVPGAETRYRLLETVRQYAREKLLAAGEGDHLRARHLHFFVQLAEEAEPELIGPDQIAWLDRLEAEVDNVRAALNYSQESEVNGEAEAGLRLAVALSRFWVIRGQYRLEAGRWLETALAQSKVAEQSLIRAAALRLSVDLNVVGRERLNSYAEESVAIFRQAGPAGRRGLAYALSSLGGLAWFQGDFGRSFTLLNESIAVFRELGDKWGLARSVCSLAATRDPLVNYQPRAAPDAPVPLPELAPAARNDHSAERAEYEESLGLFRALGDRVSEGWALGSMALMYICWGERLTGQALFAELLQIQREFRDQVGEAGTLRHLGRDLLAHDELDQAALLFDECQAMLSAVHGGDRDAAIGLLQAEIARRLGDYAQAIPLMQATLEWCRKVGNPDFIAAVLDGQGRVARSQGDHAAAHALHHEALVLRRFAGHPIHLAHSFHALAVLSAEQPPQAERAARLFGAARPYHAALYANWSTLPIWRAEHERGLAAVTAQLGEARTAALMAEGEAMTLEQAYAYALET